MVQDITSNAQAVCEGDLKDKFFGRHEVHLFFSLTLSIPFIFMAVLAVVARSLHPYIHKGLNESAKYHPGFTLTGMYLLAFVLSMDIVALIYYVKDKHEFKDDEVHGEFNVYITIITFTFDLIICSQFALCMLYLCCTRVDEKKCSLPKNIILTCFTPFFMSFLAAKYCQQYGKVRRLALKLHHGLYSASWFHLCLLLPLMLGTS